MDILNGPFSAEYGDFSGLGVAHIRLKETLPNLFTARLQGGSFGAVRAFVAYSPQFDRADSFIAYEGTHTDGPFISPLRYQRDNVTGNYTWHISEKESLGFKLNFGRNDFFSSGQIPLDLVADGQLDRFGYVDPSTEAASGWAPSVSTTAGTWPPVTSSRWMDFSRGIPAANDLESSQCVHLGIQRAGSGPAIQGDSQVGEFLEPVLTIVPASSAVSVGRLFPIRTTTAHDQLRLDARRHDQFRLEQVMTETRVHYNRLLPGFRGINRIRTLRQQPNHLDPAHKEFQWLRQEASKSALAGFLGSMM